MRDHPQKQKKISALLNRMLPLNNIRKKKSEQTPKLLSLPQEVDITDLNPFRINTMLLQWQYSQNVATDKLCFAARFHQIPMLRRLAQQNPELVNQSGALAAACLAGDFEIVRILVEEFKANINMCTGGTYPIHKAIESQQDSRLSIINYLIDKDANIHEVNEFGETAIQTCLRKLSFALEKNSAEYFPVLQCLLQAGAILPQAHWISNCTLEGIYHTNQHQPELIAKLQEIVTYSQSNAATLHVNFGSLNLNETQPHSSLMLK